MKSKMKSTFAIIAVALMVLVAVVPMVGVFTETSDAETIVVPDDVATVTISGKVYSSTGTGEKDKIVKVSWGGSYEDFDVTDNNGAYSFDIISIAKDGQITNVRIAVITDRITEIEDERYSVVTFSSLEPGAYNADLISGYKQTKEVTVKFNGGTTSPKSLFTTAYGVGTTPAVYGIYVTYDLYGKYDSTTKEYSESIYSGAYAKLADDKFTVSVGKDVASAYVKITKISVIPELGDDEIAFDVTGNGTANIVSGTETVTFAQYTATITNSNLDLPIATIDVSKVKKDTFESTKIQMVTVLLEKSKKVYYIYDQPVNTDGQVQTADKVTYKASYGTVDTTITDAGISSNNTNLTTPYLLYGTYKMNTVSAIYGTALNIALATKDETGYHDGSSLSTYVGNGCYVAKFAEGDVGAKYLKITSTGFAFSTPAMNATSPDYTDGTITLAEVGNSQAIGVKYGDGSGYTLLSGQLKDAANAQLKRSVVMTITSDQSTAYAFGQPYSGNTISVLTDEYGAYSVYLATSSTVKFAPGQYESYTLTNADGQYTIVGNAYTFNPTVAAKTMKFSFVDGDGKALETVPQFYAKFGDDNWSAAALTITDGKYVINDGTVDLDDTLVYFVGTAKNSFAAYDEDTAIEYEVNEKGVMKVVANESTYAIVVKDAEGQTVTSAVDLTINYYAAYVSETGNVTYVSVGAAIASVLTADGEREFYVSDKFVGVEIGAEVEMIIAFTITGTNLIFDDIYQFEPASGTAVMIVESYADSYSSVLLRNDGETGIPGIVVRLFNAAADINDDAKKLDKTITDENGEFEFLTTKAIDKTNAVVVFTDANGYDFADYNNAFFLKFPLAYFTPLKDAYSLKIKDADGGKVSLTGVTITGTPAAGDPVATDVGKSTFSANWEAGDIVQFTATKADATYRTFAPYILTDDDIASGVISLSTLESTYVIFVEDSEENGLAIAPTVKKLFGGTVKEDLVVTNDINKVTATLVPGIYTVLFTEPEHGYEYIALPGASADYKFAKDLYVVFEDEEATLTSLYTTIYFGVTDAAGNPLSLNGLNAGDFKVTPDYGTTQITMKGIAAASNMFYFIGSESAAYSPTAEWTIATSYHVPTSAVIIENEIAAKEQKVTFTVTDANGVLLNDAGGVTITAYDALGVQQAVIVDNQPLVLGEVSAIYEVDDYVYGLTGVMITALLDYTFDYTATTLFVANEGTYKATFATANGYDINDDMDDYVIAAYDEIGAAIMIGDEDGITVDLEKAAYFRVYDFNEVWTFETSESLGFIANESYITGSVPYSGKGNGGAVTIELYLEDNLVKEIADDDHAFLIDKYNYGAIIDLSDYVVNGVPFDSILVVYYENNVEIASAAVDPFSTVNNIVSPTVQVYVAVLDAPSALIARHVSIAQVGNTATVSADGQFIVADDDAIYTDGQYIYTFAGWFVDNEKVSASPSFTFTMTENVIIVPEYTVKYEKISDANAQVDPEIIIEEITKENTGIDTNVLIIGICAVIVALIAVVYAVIKKE